MSGGAGEPRTSVDLSAPARVGRDLQLYKDGVRQAAGCVPLQYQEGRLMLLLVQSTKRDDWILPKGGWEVDETREDAAARETYEESGAIGELGEYIGCFNTNSPKGTLIDSHFYIMKVTQLLDEWPEDSTRSRKWVPFSDATSHCQRPVIGDVIQAAQKFIITKEHVKYMGNALSYFASASKVHKAIVLILLWKLLRKALWLIKYHDKKLPPKVFTYLPYGIERIIASLFIRAGQPYAKFEKFRQTYGNTYQYGLLGRSQVAVYDPSSIQHFLAKNWENYEKGPFFTESFYPLLGRGIFNVNGEEWRFHRQTARPHFQKVELGTMVPTFIKHANHLLRYLESSSVTGQVLDVQDIFFRFTMDSVGDILFGHNIDSLNKPNAFATAFDTVQKLTIRRAMLYPFWKYFSSPKFDLNIDVIRDFVEKVVDEGLADPKLGDRQDLLAEYIKSQPTPTRDYLKDMLTNMLIAGRDTTAVLLTWFFYELSLHPDVEARVVAEIDDVIGDEPPSAEKLDSLRYLKNVLNETLRLHPSVPSDLRTAVKDDVLPNGYFIEAGTSVFYHAYVIHRMKEHWGPDADVFDPDRFEPERFRSVPNFAFVPFHAGPRICLGQNMAYTEAKVAAVLILQKYRLRLEKGFEPKYFSAVILQSSNGMRMTVEKRK